MTDAKPKKATTNKVASKAAPKAAPSTSEKAPAKKELSSGPAAAAKGAATAPPKKAAVDGVDLARQRRLARAGVGEGLCHLLGVPLDVGPRSNPWLRPTTIGDDVVSELGAVILASGIPPDALDRAAARLRKGGQS